MCRKNINKIVSHHYLYRKRSYAHTKNRQEFSSCRHHLYDACVRVTFFDTRENDQTPTPGRELSSKSRPGMDA